jgi:hypothetical protein
MEALAVLAALAAFALVFAGVPLAIVLAVAFERRRRALAAKVERLERELAALRAAGAPTAQVATKPEPPEVSPARVEPTLVVPPPRAPEPTLAPAPPPRMPLAPPAPVAPPVAGAPPPPAPARAAPSIDWERWIGIRGAAVLGGIVLALAGLLFVQYSIQKGWISPAVRCAFAAAAGAAAIAFSSWLLGRGYAVTANALTGAGATILYAATWAARMLYELVPGPLALGAMVAITALCGWLAVRRSSQLVAIFGLLGGFATPLLLSLGGEEPLGLFAYLLLLDAAVLALGRRSAWPVVGLLASLASPLIFLFWLVNAPPDAPVLFPLAFCGVSAIAFAVGALDRSERCAWTWARGVGVLSSFVFAAYFAAKADTPVDARPIGILTAVLVACSLWVDRRRRSPELVLGAALGTLGTLLVLGLANPPREMGWTLSVVAMVTVALAHGAVELRARGGAIEASRFEFASAFALGALLVAGVAGLRGEVSMWPWLSIAAVAALSLARQGAITASAWLHIVGSALAALVFAAARHGEIDPLAVPSPALEVALLAGIVAVAGLPLALAKSESIRLFARWALAAVAVELMLERGYLLGRDDVRPALALGAIVGLLSVGLIAMRRLPSIAFGLVALVAWLAELPWTAVVLDLAGYAPLVDFEPPQVDSLWTLLFVLASWCAVSAAPWLRSAERGSSNWAWRIAGAALAVWVVPFGRAIESYWERAPDSTAFAAGTALALAATLALRRERTSVGFAWFGGATALLFALAVAIEVGSAEDLMAAAFVAVGWAACARIASEHRGLRWLALATSAWAAVRMPVEVARAAADPELHSRSGYLLLHWLAYATLVPAVALLATARLLAPREKPSATWKALSTTIGLAGALGVFLWLNVEVVNAFSHGSQYEFTLERMPERDVAMSIAWAVYALALLVIGASRRSSPMRWTSLVFLLATIAKVFLYDVGELAGLHRVASLVGLALSLIAMSLFYQRFVFRAERKVTGA